MVAETKSKTLNMMMHCYIFVTVGEGVYGKRGNLIGYKHTKNMIIERIYKDNIIIIKHSND